ncbi:MAG: deoxyhypusine synthase [Nanoarchaeota archaeon]|nr:deoxyhypusine synthase [Nanoarchaeota archaeon]
MRQSSKGYIPKTTANVDHLPKIKGWDFNEKFDLQGFLKSYGTTGMQASNLGEAITITKAMMREKATIFLSYTSNMVSSGIRESIRHLVEKKKVHALITTTGGIEEDLIKCLKPFVLGSFKAEGRFLYEEGINRTGNLFVPDDRYAYFEKFVNPLLEKLYKEQKKTGKIISAAELIDYLGSKMDDKSSILYWAHKNKIPVFCPAIMDGSLGDLLFFHKQRHRDFQLDVTEDMQKIVTLAMNAEKTGVLCLGGGVSKHFCMNAQIFREGADFAVYINTAAEYDGSDSGASTDEAVSWGKIKAGAPQVKVTGDATILFPLLLAGVLEGK